MNLHRTILLFVVAAAACAQDLGPTLVRAAQADTPPSAGGFIHRWLVLEPIAANGLTDSIVQSLVKKEYFPDQLAVIPRDGEIVSLGDAQLKWHALETRLYNVNLFHFARALGKPTSNVLFWAVTIVNAPEEIAGVRLAIGSNAASVWWLNGQEVIGIYGDRQTVIDDGISKRLTLRKGLNVIRAAIVNGGGATDFCARLLDAQDRPLQGFTIRLSDGPVASAGAKSRAPIEQQLTFTPRKAGGIYEIGETVGWTVSPGAVPPKYSWKRTVRRNN